METVLLPLSKNEPVDYVRFDCSTFTLLPAKKMIPKRLNIIEGSYSMHPELAGWYDFGVFLDVSPALQEERIKSRNSPEQVKRFFEEWIPMENRYFNVLLFSDRIDITL